MSAVFSADTDRMRRQMFAPYSGFTKRTEAELRAAAAENRNLFSSERRSEIDQQVEDMPTLDDAVNILRLIHELPEVDQAAVAGVAATFEAIEAANVAAAGSAGTTTGSTRH